MDEMLFCRNGENGEMTLPLAIGRDENGRPLWLDLAAASNILLAGCTKQGKSVAMNAMIASLMLLKGQEEVKFIFIDPKRAELAVWAGTAGSRYAGGESEANAELDRLTVEMESRLSGLARDPRRKYSKIVVFVDEYADLMDYCYICRKSDDRTTSVSYQCCHCGAGRQHVRTGNFIDRARALAAAVDQYQHGQDDVEGIPFEKLITLLQKMK